MEGIVGYSNTHLTWFYLHIIAISIILIADSRGTLGPTIIEFEKKIGIHIEPQETEDIEEK
jgi:hypothetical protein|tara:strand:- start:338 stop:520 length:183 start_codon:yes stop_codon:yes gene_type:complete